MNARRIFLFLFLLSASFFAPLNAACNYEQVVQANQFQVGVMLTWSTHIELDHERFIVEKSENGIDFTEIGTVTGGGTTDATKEYNFLHIYPNENRLYYRLREINFNGVISYSDIVIFENEAPSLVRVVRLSEVFAKNDFSVKLDSYTEGELKYNLKNWRGEELVSETINLTNGLVDVNLDMKEMPEGIYKLDLILDGKKLDVLTFKRVIGKEEDKTPTARKN